MTFEDSDISDIQRIYITSNSSIRMENIDLQNTTMGVDLFNSNIQVFHSHFQGSDEHGISLSHSQCSSFYDSHISKNTWNGLHITNSNVYFENGTINWLTYHEQ